MIVVIHLITVIEWESFRKYHIKQCVFRNDFSKTKNILSFYTACAYNRHNKEARYNLSVALEKTVVHPDTAVIPEWGIKPGVVQLLPE